jgi:hypothetical protein
VQEQKADHWTFVQITNIILINIFNLYIPMIFRRINEGAAKVQPRRFPISIGLYLFILAILTPTIIAHAQEPATCMSQLQQALQDTNTVCAPLGINQSCLGSGAVQRQTSSGQVSPTYTTAGTRAEITTTHAITTGADGVNVLKVQIPGAASDEGLVIIQPPGMTITNVRGSGLVWNNITFTTSADVCAGAEQLIIQSPENVPTTITLNGIQIEMHSTIGISSYLQGFGYTQVYVHEGVVNVHGTRVPAGYTVFFHRVGNGYYVSPPQLMSPAELRYFELLRRLSPRVLNYTLGLPTLACPSGVGGAECVG